MWIVIFRTVKVSAVGLCSTVRLYSPVEQPASGSRPGLSVQHQLASMEEVMNFKNRKGIECQKRYEKTD